MRITHIHRQVIGQLITKPQTQPGAVITGNTRCSIFSSRNRCFVQRHTDTMEHDGNLIGTAASFRGRVNPALTLTDETLASVTAPTLFLWGEDDGFGGRDVADAVVGPMPNASLEMVDDAGHLPWLDFPTEIGSRTRTFLAMET